MDRRNLPIWHGDSSLNAPGHPSSISSGKSQILSDIFSLQFRSRGSIPPPHVTLHGCVGSHPVHSHFGSPLQVSHSSRSPQPQSGFSRSQSPSQSRYRNFCPHPPNGASHSVHSVHSVGVQTKPQGHLWTLCLSFFINRPKRPMIRDHMTAVVKSRPPRSCRT